MSILKYFFQRKVTYLFLFLFPTFVKLQITHLTEEMSKSAVRNSMA